jgi:hypothetical protein
MESFNLIDVMSVLVHHTLHRLDDRVHGAFEVVESAIITLAS